MAVVEWNDHCVSSTTATVVSRKADGMMIDVVMIDCCVICRAESRPADDNVDVGVKEVCLARATARALIILLSALVTIVMDLTFLKWSLFEIEL